MAICPYCSCEVIDGEDNCPDCHHSLVDLSLPTPATVVERALLKDRLGELGPNTSLVTVDVSTRLQDAMQTMCQEGVGCLLVMEDGQLAGIFSERDALVKVGASVEECCDQPVGRYMTPAPQTLPITAKVAFAVHRMELGGFRHLPLVDADGQPAAVVSVRDILDYLAKLAPDHAEA